MDITIKKESESGKKLWGNSCKKWDLRGAKLEDSTERCSLPRSGFLDVTPSSPQRDIQKTAARETMKDGDGRKAATLWGQSDFG